MLLKNGFVKDIIIITTEKFRIQYNIKENKINVNVQPMELYNSNNYCEYLSMLEQELKKVRNESKIVDKIIQELVKLKTNEEIIEYINSFNAGI